MMSDEKKLTDEQLNGVSGGANYIKDKSWTINGENRNTGTVDEETDPMKKAIEDAKKNGITLSEMAEIVTHAAFYAGWPNAWAVFNLVKEVYAEEIQNNNIDKGTTHGGAFGMGEPNVNYAQYFIGSSYLKVLEKYIKEGIIHFDL